MRDSSRARRVPTLWAPLVLAGLLGACDPAMTVHLVRKDMKPMSCEDGAEMTYKVLLQYRDGDRFEDRFEVDRRINHPTIGMLPGGIEREVAWIQFELYCGDAEKPVLVTPRICLPTDLVRKDEKNYYYYVDWKSFKRGTR